ncbi:glucans biosynthesis glucosyltransferase MdoH [Methylocystis sp. MJC1]|jgi:membrane glycosyltransferase|uniref:glucans biosynthesis glucosyltransferase MdoH n=1 Tax=Methylocystis sp. MJC1 TaxID=2654282 RepID=UPI0013EA1321|nr:glucans biosynthesis glucosyltransferase MdoH [Methylocystis sp. MJC1]KAF2989457.1 Glucans biosynthesis glucosyltransferase H [Methylocystis sp. MJC1]MBU6527952.1 glucans biosynthesis glucosyltransferase MdoH [Methylocystis sp. MJC1]UZX10872.1 glucans biosynthesis glucosyltransferase MdoH [Methylocystis sp. MJC1]
MDSLTLTPVDSAQPAPAFKDPAAAPPTPIENRLSMPAQNIFKFEQRQRRKLQAQSLWRTPWLARLVTFGGGLALTVYGGWQMYKVIDVGGVTTLKWALLALFILNFSWIALSFASSVVGFVALLSRRPSAGLPETLREKTAVVMPIYNEAPSRVFAALQTIYEDIQATGLGENFDWFFLSDTTNPDVWIAEERAFIAIRRRLGPNASIFYRRREKNTGRKAGNIEDFVSRWGGFYAHMVVLDADSLMTGPTIVKLAAAMEADPDSGIIQTLPLIINRNTLFARVQQFAARIYGPVIATGLACWMGRDGNYWGHNAIIRTEAFARHCGLPDLHGRPPWGGHIMSHDFVEAALIRRAGYAVYMLPRLGGSYEESPPSLIDLSTRDRRWCQGNLQHSRVLFGRGLCWASRQHFLTGIFGYLTSPLWLLQLLVGIVIVFQASYFKPEYFTSEFALFPTFPRFDAERSLELFALTMGILLAPKFFGLLVAIYEPETRRGSGGVIMLLISTLFEIVLSALLAPIMMLIQTGHVVHIVFGFDTGWDPQRRDDGSVPLIDIVRRHRSHMAMGALSLVAGLLISPSLVAWMSPTIAGLILAIPISWLTSQRWLGLVFRRAGVLVTPEETTTPPIAKRGKALSKALARGEDDEVNAIVAIHADPELRTLHEAWLPTRKPRQRGVITADRAVAEAKVADAETIEDAVAWLNRGERLVALSDRALIGMIARLPRRADLQEAQAAE